MLVAPADPDYWPPANSDLPLTLDDRTPERVYPLAAIRVSDERIEPSYAEQFEVLRTNADLIEERERIAPYLDAEPDKTLAFIAEMDTEGPHEHGHGHEAYGDGHEHGHAAAGGIEWEDDTVLVRTGETVDILLDLTNVGRWMAHCHIAEHHESGMMFSFEVTE